MIGCEKCGLRYRGGSESCQNCGTFLGYEWQEAGGAGGSVLLTVSPGMAAVAPGSQVSAGVRVRNKSNIVDQYETQVAGEADSWTDRPKGHRVLWLSERERQVLRLLAEGFDTAQVGRRLCLSERTVKNAIHNFAGRSGLRNRTHAVAHALRHGLI